MRAGAGRLVYIVNSRGEILFVRGGEGALETGGGGRTEVRVCGSINLLVVFRSGAHHRVLGSRTPDY